jgi:hypothetical protein
MITFADDGSFQADPGTLIPTGWVRQGNRYVPTWPICRYRCLSHGASGRLPWCAIHCRLRKLTGTIETCLACDQAEVDETEDIPQVDENGKQIGVLKVSKRPDRSIPTDDKGNPVGGVIWIPDPPVIPPPPPEPEPEPAPAPAPIAAPRPDLAAIANTLPPTDPKPEQTFRRPIFNADGSIEYPKADDDWEPPANINGYIRDPQNEWRFLPLWPICTLRVQSAFLKANCGCIDLTMRCNNPQAPSFGMPVMSTVCTDCKVRSQ